LKGQCLVSEIGARQNETDRTISIIKIIANKLTNESTRFGANLGGKPLSAPSILFLHPFEFVKSSYQFISALAPESILTSSIRHS
jgi:hypothetical protein